MVIFINEFNLNTMFVNKSFTSNNVLPHLINSTSHEPSRSSLVDDLMWCAYSLHKMIRIM